MFFWLSVYSLHQCFNLSWKFVMVLPIKFDEYNDNTAKIAIYVFWQLFTMFDKVTQICNTMLYWTCNTTTKVHSQRLTTILNQFSINVKTACIFFMNNRCEKRFQMFFMHISWYKKKNCIKLKGKFDIRMRTLEKSILCDFGC